MYLNKKYDLEPETTITIEKKRYVMRGELRLLKELHKEFGEITTFASGIFSASYENLSTVIRLAINDDSLSQDVVENWVVIFNGVADTRCLVYEFLAVTIGGKKNELETRKKVELIFQKLKNAQKKVINSLGQNTEDSA